MLLIIFLLATCPAHAGTAPQPPDGVLATPKYQSLRFTRVKMHTGPGQQYPVTWVYQRKNLPVKVTATYDVWRKIVDADGVSGWVQETMLSDKRSVEITDKRRILHSDPSDEAGTVALADPGTVALISQCRAGWCQVKFDAYAGWLKQDEVWGTTANEDIAGK
jgi:SH3-like domain-containing protein